MLTTEEVRHIASLARIRLSDEETESYRKDLSSVLDFFRELGRLDLSSEFSGGDVPTKENDTREDVAVEFGSVGREGIMKNVPERKNGFVRVKPVF